MTKSFRNELYRLAPAWLACVLLPMPAILFWHSVHGRSIALGCFFAGCATLVAFSFGREILSPPGGTTSHKKFVVPCCASLWLLKREDLQADLAPNWREKMEVLLTALLAAFVVFSILCLAFNNPPEDEPQAIWWRSSMFRGPRDLIATMLAFMTLIPTLGLVPYLTLRTRSRFAAVIFSLFLVFGMKLLGAIVVVFVYGWNAAEEGHTRMPWHHPDLLVWLFWGFNLVLSLSFYFLGARQFCLARSGSTAC